MDFMKQFDEDDGEETAGKDDGSGGRRSAASSDDASSKTDENASESGSNASEKPSGSDKGDSGSDRASSAAESAGNADRDDADSEGEGSESKAAAGESAESSDDDDEGPNKDSARMGSSKIDDDDDESDADEAGEASDLYDSQSSKKGGSPKKKDRRTEFKELLEIAGDDVCRRSGRQRKEVQQFQIGENERAKRREGRAHKRVVTNESDSDSGSGDSSDDYRVRRKAAKRPTTRNSKAASKKRPRRGGASSGSDDDLSDGGRRRRTTRAENKSTKDVNYREVGTDNDVDSDDVLEWDDESSRLEGAGAADNSVEAETIERVLDNRRGIPGAVGYQTTRYNVTDKGDPNAGFVPRADEKGERQYLIKWVNWSHLHNTWESEESLATMGAKGIKKLENYIKRMKEIERWRKRADKESIEYFDCEQKMNEQLLDTYTKCERIIAHQMARDSSNDSEYEYYVKWSGLPHADCTWEDGRLLQRYAAEQIDAYHVRTEARKLPNKNCPYLRRRPKFEALTEQPEYLGAIEERELRDYQLTGLNWMLRAWCKSNSVILADEMGLGKTIQTISFLSSLLHRYELNGPFLVVAPLSTIAAWTREFAKWAPDLNLVTYIGDVGSRNVIRQYEWFVGGTKKLKFNAVLTTYEILLKDKAFLGSVDWAVLMVDEAHRLKNDESHLYLALANFSTNHRLLITGTPLQNSLRELYSLLRFIMPDRFDDWSAWEARHDRSKDNGFGQLHAELEPFLLRRIKKDVEKSLPAKVEQLLRVDMTTQQRKYYKLILTRNYQELSRGVKGSITGFINIVMELKKCCNHTHLVRQPDEEPPPSERLQQLLKGSGKLILLDKLLSKLYEQKHRVLIFSQMVMMLDVVQEYLELRRWNYQRLDGSMGSSLRDQALDHFNAENSTDFCFLLSTRAGGLGINLATADTVIIFDSDWNPQNDLQAQARAHRIGQKKQVNIYRLVTKSSVEEDIVERAKQKLVLDHLVIQRMDTTGRTVLAKNAISSNSKVPFDKSELTNILKFGAAELFSKDEDEEEPEVDVDDILQRAETRELEEQSGMAGELLDAFKVANFAIDEDRDVEAATTTNKDVAAAAFADWDSIIPEDEREQVKADQLTSVIIDGPRQRTKIQQMARNEDSDDEAAKKKKPATSKKGGGNIKGGGGDIKDEPDTSDSADTSDDDTGRVKKRRAKYTILTFTDNEVRKFLRAFRRFAVPLERLDAIAESAELSEHSQSELRALCEELIKGCKAAGDEYDAQRDKENKADNDESSKKRDRGACFKFGGVDVYVRALTKTQQDLQPLYAVMPADVNERKCFELSAVPKPCRGWDVVWDKNDDELLLRGIYEYGMGSWDSIKMDPMLGLTEKILDTDKTKKPQAKQLAQRADYLLKLLHKAAKPTGAGGGRAKPQANDNEEPAKPKRQYNKRAAAKDKETAAKQKKPLKKTSDPKKVEPVIKEERPKRSKGAESAAYMTSLEIDKQYESAVETSESPKFQDCVNILRPITKAMRLLTEEDEAVKTKGVLKLGDFIGQYLIINEHRFSTKKLKNKWFSILWIFASKFIDDEAQALVDLYRAAAAKREAEAAENEQETEAAEGKDKKHHHHHKHKHHHQHHKKETNNNNNNNNNGKEEQEKRDDQHDHKPSTSAAAALSTPSSAEKPLKSALKKPSVSNDGENTSPLKSAYQDRQQTDYSSYRRETSSSSYEGGRERRRDRDYSRDRDRDRYDQQRDGERDRDRERDGRHYHHSRERDRGDSRWDRAGSSDQPPPPRKRMSDGGPPDGRQRSSYDRRDSGRYPPQKRQNMDYQRTGYSRQDAYNQRNSSYGRGFVSNGGRSSYPTADPRNQQPMTQPQQQQQPPATSGYPPQQQPQYSQPPVVTATGYPVVATSATVGYPPVAAAFAGAQPVLPPPPVASTSTTPSNEGFAGYSASGAGFPLQMPPGWQQLAASTNAAGLPPPVASTAPGAMPHLPPPPVAPALDPRYQQSRT